LGSARAGGSGENSCGGGARDHFTSCWLVRNAVRRALVGHFHPLGRRAEVMKTTDPRRARQDLRNTPRPPLMPRNGASPQYGRRGTCCVQHTAAAWFGQTRSRFRPASANHATRGQAGPSSRQDWIAPSTIGWLTSPPSNAIRTAPPICGAALGGAPKALQTGA